MQISYTFHISSKQHAITTTKQLSTASKHNLRKYSSQGNQTGHYDSDKIVQLAGTDNLFRDVEKVFHEQFDQALKEYNENQKRVDRRIPDYMRYVSENGKSDLAVEAIIQLGDMEFWERVPEGRKWQMTYIFKDQLKALRQYIPEFVIANAVVHYDEASPHMHVIGVPVASGYKRGLSKQCAKTKVFTRDSLEKLQDALRERAVRGMKKNPEIFDESSMKPKEQGRNSDYSKEYYVRNKKEELAMLVKEISEKEEDLFDIEDETDEAKALLETAKTELSKYSDASLKEIRKNKEEAQRLNKEREQELRDAEEKKKEAEKKKKELEEENREIDRLSVVQCPFREGDHFEIDGEMITAEYIYPISRKIEYRTPSGKLKEIPLLDAVKAYNTFLQKTEMTEECVTLEKKIAGLKEMYKKKSIFFSQVCAVWDVFDHFPAIKEFVFDLAERIRNFHEPSLSAVASLFKEKVLGIKEPEQERTRSRSR